MATSKLTDRKVAAIKGPGKVGDGGGLWLICREGGSKQWYVRYTFDGKRREMGLGGYPVVTLAAAREAALEARRMVRAGTDPIMAQKQARGVPSFADACHKVHQINLPGWRNPKHGAQFISTLETYAFPAMGELPVTDVQSHHVLAALQPIWLDKQETARRVKQRIGTVMQWVMAEGWRKDNPVDAASAGLPKQRAKVERRKALPYDEVAGCIAAVQASGAHPRTKAALELLILCASRSGEVRGATWAEIDLEARVWTIPASRMKAEREHRVPLSDRCVALLVAAKTFTDGSDLVFAGSKRGKEISDATMRKLIRELGFPVDVHGFRSSFRDWASECTDTPREVAEQALAHHVGNEVERAYSRSDLLDKRRLLMDRWAEFLSGSTAKVVSLHG